MDRRFTRLSDGESSGSSKRQRVEGHASGGFASGPAGRDHLRFTGTATATINFDIDLVEQHEARDQAELDLELRLGLPQVDSASPRDQNKQKQAEFAQKNKPLELNRDDPKELVLREFTCARYNKATHCIRRRIYKIKNYKGTGRYSMKELNDSLTKIGQFHPQKIKESNIQVQDIYKRLQEIIENPSNNPEKSAAELLVYHMTRKD